MTITRAAIAGVVGILLAFASPASAGSDISQDRLKALLAWGAAFLGVSTKDVDLPRIVLTSQHNIMVEFYGAKAVAETDAKPNVSLVDVRAIYQRDTRTMILNEAVDYTDPENEYTLVHELVHHLQAVHDIDSDAACPGVWEVDAYRAQNLWVMATGAGEAVDPLSMFLFTVCPSSGYRR